MKTITLFFAFLATTFAWQMNAQTLNKAANWPNANWTLNVIEHTGSNTQDIEADPTVDANFSYDDDDTGMSSHDFIAAESPVIDLTAAFNAGETNITVSGDYVYNNLEADEYLAIEYYDAAAADWVLLYQFDNVSTTNAPDDNYCSGIHDDYTSSDLDISGFTAAQLSGFKYRLIYNDGGPNGWNQGFCFGSPTITSSGDSSNAPVATFTVDPDCANSQFSVVVNVTSLEGATSVTIADNQSSSTQSLSAPGNVTFGPYASSTEVEITVTNNDDTSKVTTGAVKYDCPPANDDCVSAIDLTLDQDACVNSVSVSNLGSTDSGVPAPSCGSYDSSGSTGDMWYKITIPTGVTEITLNVNNVAPSSQSVAGALYSGDCNQLSEVGCVDLFAGGWPWSIFNLTPGSTYYLRVWDYNNDATITFDLCGYYASLAISDHQISDFTYYPNPVNDMLNLSAKSNIESVLISNVMGQEVLKLQSNMRDVQLNMSRLQKGIYFVKVQIDGKLTAFKVVKK